MSSTSFLYMDLPLELQDLILSFLDYPNLITILTVNKHIHFLAKNSRLLRDPEIRIQFLLSKENERGNHNPSSHDTYPGENWRWPNHSPKKSYICFYCRKIKPLRMFAHGQCYRMMLDDNYTKQRKRFCLECGVKDLEPRDMGAGILVPGGRKYVPGAMMNSVDHGFRVHLCGGCGEWSRDFYCMKDKLCFSCTEKNLEQPERFVEGFQEGPRPLSNEIDRTFDDEALRKCGVWEELLARWRIEEIDWIRRPPCCRKCGEIWRFNPNAFGWHYGVEKKRPYIWRHGYKISGRPVHEIMNGGEPYEKEYLYRRMDTFYPFPNMSWRDYSLCSEADFKTASEMDIASEVLE